MLLTLFFRSHYARYRRRFHVALRTVYLSFHSASALASSPQLLEPAHSIPLSSLCSVPPLPVLSWLPLRPASTVEISLRSMRVPPRADFLASPTFIRVPCHAPSRPASTFLDIDEH